MKILKIIMPLLVFALVLSFLPACGSGEPEQTAEPVEEKSTANEPEVTEETSTQEAEEIEEIEEIEETEEVEETEETAVDEEPELLWVFKHEDQDFKLQSIDVSPDGQTLTVGSYLTTYTHLLYDGALVDAITTHRHSVDDMDFSPDGSVMGIGTATGGVSLIDAENGTELFQLHTGYDNRLSFSPDGKHVATANRDGLVWIWDIESGDQIAELEAPETGKPGYIWTIDYHPSGSLLAALHWSDEATVNIWNVDQKQITSIVELNTLVGSTKHAFKFSPDEEIMAGIIKEDFNDKVRLWTVDGSTKISDLEIEKMPIDIAFSPDGSLIAVASIHLATTVWDVSTGTLLYTLDQTLEGTTSGTRALTFTPDGGHLALVRNDGPLELWCLPGAKPLPEPEIDIKELPPLPSDVLFDTGSSELKAGADEVLVEFAQNLDAVLDNATITFIGHTDSRGDADSNMQLSLERATAVKDWFEAWAQDDGIEGWEFLVKGLGDTELKVPDVDAEGNFREEAGRLNRRVEIEIEV
ncbi:MAG: OmpA family protein [Actinobacteria bacterium]|nr:OmpA family protein [Actinomycetota bacterium]